MTPPRNIIGTLFNSPLLRDARQRRIVFVVLALVFAILTLFPQKFRAAMSMTPTDPASLGLSAALGESGAVNSAFGSQAAVEVVLKVGRSKSTRLDVIKSLDLMKRMNFSNVQQADRWLDRSVYIRSLRGGIISIESWKTDPELARQLVGGLADATRNSLSEISRRQTSYKRGILTRLLDDADKKLAAAQADYDRFRRDTRYAQPGNAISGIGSRVGYLKEVIRSKQVQLYAARQFATDENLSVRQLLAEIDSLNVQLKKASSLNSDQTDSVGDVVEKSTHVRELERILQIAHARHDNYQRLLEGTSVEDITKDAVVRVIEPPYVDSERQYNLLPMAIGILIVMLGLALEFYGLRPPVGEPRHAI